MKKMKKILIAEDRWNEVIMFLTKENITWSTGRFHFDIPTAIVVFIITTIAAILIGNK